jgi:hypothetical protein
MPVRLARAMYSGMFFITVDPKHRKKASGSSLDYG